MNVCFILVISVISQLGLSLIMGWLLPEVTEAGFLYYFQLALLSFVSVCIPAYLYLRDEKRKYFTDCFQGVKPSKAIAVCIGIGLAGQYTGVLCNLPVNLLFYSFGIEIPNKVPEITNFASYLGAVVTMCVLPAVFEEVMFRGIVLNYFRQFGKKSAILFSSLLFAIMHFDITNFLATFILGIVLAVLVCRSNRTVYSMIAHFTVNFTSVTTAFIMSSELGMDFLMDIQFVLIAVAVPVLIYLMGIFKASVSPLPYKDQEQYEMIVEKIYPINEENSIRIVEHDIRENNMGMAFKKLYGSVYFYIIFVLFIVLGGAVLWK
ncbi:MAG: CPBP family intramembrane metalloprotease [Ruminococcaceae bacterium]|nr:CPBP family intramembrane metalloprotease [Oscillospiraceae bacterium]